MQPKNDQKRWRLVTMLIETFGFSPAVASAISLVLMLLCLAAVVWVVRSAPPRKIVLTSGPEGSSFRRWADAYTKALAARGVTLEVRPSAGALENLQRLQSPEAGVDLGFIPGGLAKADALKGLVSLGSVAYQPIWVFYRSPEPLGRLSDLAGKRVAVGAPGSGTRSLALTLLEANGITGAPTTFVDSDAGAAAADLVAGKLDAIFLMGDSAPLQTLRTMLRTPDIRLYNFQQADAYVRRLAYLTKMRLPEGSIDLGKNLPAEDVTLVGPTVELVAREGLNSALSDLLLEAAREIHGRSGLLQRRGEFPAPIEHEIALSEDALRYYKSGKGFFYRNIRSFWVASLLNRVLVAVVPLVLVIIPAIRFLPVAYRMSIQLRLYRCYRPLLRLERESFSSQTPERVRELLAELDQLEGTVNRLKVPASFADRFYELRTHVNFVRQRLKAMAG